jgi:hypothetical protein
MIKYKDINKPEKFGFYSSLAMTILTFIAFGFAMIAIPPSGPYCPGDCMSYPYTDLLSYYPRDYYWMFITVFQLCTFLVFIIANHFVTSEDKKIYSFISVAFALISIIVLMTDYYIQFSVVPISVMKSQTDGIALLTQYNGHGIFIALEELGFTMMSISFMFLAFIFSKKTRLEKAIRRILFFPVIVTILSFILYSYKYGLDRDYRFEVAAITINWVVTIMVGILACIFFNNKMKANNSSTT